LQKLDALDLRGTQVSDEGLQVLWELKNLRLVYVQNTKVTEQGVKRLASALPRCKIDWDGSVTGPSSKSRFTNSLGIEFALVPKGKTWMGGMAGKAPNDEMVEFNEDFYLGVYEVTQEEWQKVMGTNPSGHSPAGKKSDAVKGIPTDEVKRFPVEMVSFDDAQEFVARLNSMLKEKGWVYRLPTQAEWQYACRGGPVGKKEELGFDFYFDRPTNVLLPDRANFNRNVGLPKKVGSYLPNALGLHDMHGNVGEWCHDTQTDKDGKVIALSHGGSWTHSADWCRAVFIIRSQTFARFDDMGFRLARVPAAPQKKMDMSP
jgi:formylglycine-generating enzyme required for sulfatase activity